jgi:hypothetical protein
LTVQCGIGWTGLRRNHGKIAAFKAGKIGYDAGVMLGF